MMDFYTRNHHIVRPVPNAKSPSELLDGRSRETILRNTFLEMRKIRAWRGCNLWSWVGAVTGHGSGYSWQICIELGWDPEMRITPTASLPDNVAPAASIDLSAVRSAEGQS